MNEATLKVNQANVFYNYTLGFYATKIDLLKTATKALKLGISTSAYFSDNKFLYLDKENKIQFEWIQPEGRQWDSNHFVSLDKELPDHIIEDLYFALENSFHENRITSIGSNQTASYVRLYLPPIVLEDDDFELPLYVSVKIFDDGIAILSFQLDGTWDGADEEFFINEVVNLFNRYFKNLWIDSRIQKLEADLIIPNAYQDQITLAGKPLEGREIRQSIRRMRKEARKVFKESMEKDGHTFVVGSRSVTLHNPAGSDLEDPWESNFDFCTLIYRNALSKLIEPDNEQREYGPEEPIHWQGRPSITLMRFEEQPNDKSELISKFGKSLVRILSRSTHIDSELELPKDLRVIDDFTFHGNRAVFLWTWTKPENAPKNAWDSPNNLSTIMNHQSRAEHIEYYNMRIARACKFTRNPPSENHLMYSYRILSMAEEDIHHSSGSGEVVDSLKTVIEDIGTMDLVPSAKESARWYLDDLRHKSEKRRITIDRWLTFVFGLVGITGISEFLVNPIVETYLIKDHLITPIISFSISTLFVIIVIVAVWFPNRK